MPVGLSVQQNFVSGIPLLNIGLSIVIFTASVFQCMAENPCFYVLFCILNSFCFSVFGGFEHLYARPIVYHIPSFSPFIHTNGGY
jgi:hypothetical protein